MDAVTDVDDLTTEVQRLVAERGPRCGAVTLVAIDGPSGSGKTTLAADLGHDLDAPVLHVDDMHQGWTGVLSTVELARTSLIDAWSRGEPASHPTWDWDDERRTADQAVPQANVVVLEGVGAFAIAGDEASVKVWVEAPTDQRHDRAITRDGEVFATHWDVWADQERQLYAASLGRDAADLRIDTGPPPTRRRSETSRTPMTLTVPVVPPSP